MGWFDTFTQALPEILGGVGSIIQATNPRSPVPQPSPGAYNMSPMEIALQQQALYGGGLGAQTGALQPAALGSLVGPALRYGIPGIAGGLLGEALLGGGGGTPGTYVDVAGTDTPMFQRSTSTGRMRSKNLVEARDWNGDTRYWVGGVKLSPRWIKSKILSSQRRRRHHHHPM